MKWKEKEKENEKEKKRTADLVVHKFTSGEMAALIEEGAVTKRVIRVSLYEL